MNNRKRIKEMDRLIERICEDNINGKKTVAVDICFTGIELINVPEAKELRPLISVFYEESA